MPKSSSNSQAGIDVNFRLTPRCLPYPGSRLPLCRGPGFRFQQLICTWLMVEILPFGIWRCPPMVPLVIFSPILRGSSTQEGCVFSGQPSVDTVRVRVSCPTWAAWPSRQAWGCYARCLRPAFRRLHLAHRSAAGNLSAVTARHRRHRPGCT